MTVATATAPTFSSEASRERAHKSMFVRTSFVDLFDVTAECGGMTKKGTKCALKVSITRPGHKCGLHNK